MNAEELCFTPAADLAPMIRQKRISPVELMRAVLARIEASEPKINAMARVTADSAMDAAKAAEAALMKGQAIGPLHGIPVTIKDLHFVKGVTNERGSWTHKGFVPDTDTPFVTRLKNAGAIVVGKTTVCEFGWKGVSQSPLTGITSNPWRLGYNSGASSAGAGAAAAAGYGPLHQGSDGAGSIRMPSHFSGIFGLKPSYGRIPNWPVGGNDNTSHIGPMVRDVRDGALMMSVMSGPHPWDHTCLESGPADYVGRLGEGIEGRKIAFSPDLGHARVDPELAELVQAAVKVLASDLKAKVEQVTPAWGKDGPEIIRVMYPAHATGNAKFLAKFERQMDPGLVAMIKTGLSFSTAQYQEARDKKSAFVAAMARFMEDWDFLVTPTVSTPAFPAERVVPAHWPQHDWDWIQWAEFSYPFNFSGMPAATVPCGFTKDGLPVGMQIVGKRFDDLGVLQAAYAFSKARPWAAKRPKF
jgi:aspartyl-tRNA(Asn)/glutamyl-tRNA(Gln) amidotransferase subunit A